METCRGIFPPSAPATRELKTAPTKRFVAMREMATRHDEVLAEEHDCARNSHIGVS